jgi:hypothetical protein
MASRLSNYITRDVAFARSVNLRYDFLDPKQIERYIPTTKSSKVLGEVLESISAPGTDRSRVISGPYGSGKSAFALFLSALLRKEARLQAGLNQPLRRLRVADAQVWSKAHSFLRTKQRFLVAVINQSDRGLLLDVHAALLRALDEHSATRSSAKRLGVVLGPAKAFSSPEQALTKLSALLAELPRHGITGIYFVFDEFGKFLERFTSEQTTESLFLLQTFSEFAARPEPGNVHFLFLLHLSFGDYAHQLPLHVRNEWSKVEGRFRQISFVEDSDQVYQLIAEALGSRNTTNPHFLAVKRKWATRLWSSARSIPAFQERLAVGEWADLFFQTYPLHPVTLFALPRLSAKLGQNERTLYTYLASKEPNSLSAFLEAQTISDDNPPVVSVDQLFDYFSDYVIRDAATSTSSKRWAEVLNCLERVPATDLEAQKLIKVIGALTILNVPRLLPCTDAVLRFALDKSKSDKEFSRTLERLVDSRILVLRKYSAEYRLWQGSDIDFPQEIEKQKSLLRSGFRLDQFLQHECAPGTIAAQRYFDDFHTLRYFEGRYVNATELESATKRLKDELAAGADGFVLYVVCECPEAIQSALAHARKNDEARLVFAIPNQPLMCQETALELAGIYALQTDASFVQSDPITRRELADLADICTQRLRSLLQTLIDPYHNAAKWLTAGGVIHDVTSTQTLKRLVSEICTRVFPHTPRINNELINRKALSSSVAAARRKILAGLFEKFGEPALGLEGFGPEVSIFRSVFVKTGWYRQEGASFDFVNPAPKTNIPCVMHAIEEFLARAEGRASVGDLLSFLQRPPFGMRAGLAPLFLAVFLASHRKTAAVLENGVYVRDFGAEVFDRLLRAPATFDLQLVSLEQPQQAYLNHIRRDFKRRLDIKDLSKDTIRNVLSLTYRWLHGLPKFCLQTEHLTPETKAMRAALLTAADPVKLFFSDLPKSLGFQDLWDDPRKVSGLCRSISLSLDELSDAYDGLLRRIETDIRKVFRLSDRGDLPLILKQHLEGQPSSLEDFLLDTITLAFVRRAKMEYPSKQAWLESVASVISGTPVHSWTDSTVKQFEIGLIQAQQNITSAAQLCFNAAQGGLRVADQELVRIRIETASNQMVEAIVRIDQIPKLLEELAGRVKSALHGREPSLVEKDALTEIVLENLQTLVTLTGPNERTKPN